jgi:hypothetical protein
MSLQQSLASSHTEASAGAVPLKAATEMAKVEPSRSPQRQSASSVESKAEAQTTAMDIARINMPAHNLGNTVAAVDQSKQPAQTPSESEGSTSSTGKQELKEPPSSESAQEKRKRRRSPTPVKHQMTGVEKETPKTFSEDRHQPVSKTERPRKGGKETDKRKMTSSTQKGKSSFPLKKVELVQVLEPQNLEKGEETKSKPKGSSSNQKRAAFIQKRQKCWRSHTMEFQTAA